MTDCVFCQIIAGDAPAQIDYEWPDAIEIVPLNPVVPGHRLIIPKMHVVDFADDPVTTGMVFAHAAKAAKHVPANLITSAGAEATQTVFHMHVHVIPRFEGDTVSLPWDVRG